MGEYDRQLQLYTDETVALWFQCNAVQQNLPVVFLVNFSLKKENLRLPS
jgi:hypothetical protein